MEEETNPFNTSTDAFSNDSQESPPFFDLSQESFLNFDLKSNLSFEDKSTIYCSLITLVKARHPLDRYLQDRAAHFLKNLQPHGDLEEIQYFTDKIVYDHDPDSVGSPPDFIASIVTLISSPYSAVTAAALSFLKDTTFYSSPPVQSDLMESDLISNVLTTVQPHTLPISGNEKIINILIGIVVKCLNLADPSCFQYLGITAAIDTFNHREMIFQKVVISSSQFVTFLISNRYILNEDLLDSFFTLLRMLIRICPFHRPTLEYVLASPIVMAFSSCLSFVEKTYCLLTALGNFNQSLSFWMRGSAEVAQSATRMIEALFSEGFEDTIEQMMKNEKSGSFPVSVDKCCYSISKLLGSNVKRL
ncbi:hypothetical protein BLNAU_3476 [Blattamonas nauphoetae]|uniref:Uncharacterized protein n=1 Tax=Blattamonas nauphoetae TaxID=2049346 RepID=A0ABQ9YD36_9EUKA|nr:hypothetical protein BLNAU_3476 [Blattamonas nauphoetae]